MHPTTHTQRKVSQIDRFYDKYKHLAEIYANRVFNYERTGMTKEDIVQEMRIKIYTSILGFARQWKSYKDSLKRYPEGVRKPAPIEYWLRSALVRKVLEFTRIFNQESIENQNKISIFESSMDIGTFSTAYTETSIEITNFFNKDEQKYKYDVKFNDDNPMCIINGIDVLFGLKGERRKCFCMFVHGFAVRELISVFPDIDVKSFVERHSLFLRNRKGTDLCDFENKTYEVQHYEEA